MIKIGQFYKCKSSDGEVFTMVVALPKLSGPSIYKLLIVESTNRFYPVGSTMEVFHLDSFTRMKRPKWKIGKDVATKGDARIGQMVYDGYFELHCIVVGVHDDYVDTMVMQSDHASFDVGEVMEVSMEDFNRAPLMSCGKWKDKK